MPSFDQEKSRKPNQYEPNKSNNWAPSPEKNQSREKMPKKGENRTINPIKTNQTNPEINPKQGAKHTSLSHEPNQRTHAKKRPLDGSDRPLAARPSSLSKCPLAVCGRKRETNRHREKMDKAKYTPKNKSKQPGSLKVKLSWHCHNLQ